MKILPRHLLNVACTLLVVARAQAAAPWSMAGGNYFEGFGTIATWTNDFAGPTEATRWGSVAVNGSGTIPDGRRTTIATSAFTTTTTAGVQRGTNNLVQLSTGSTDNSSANAVDLYLDFTGRAPGTLAFDWAAVANGSGNRASSLRIYATTNGINFTELTNARVLNLSNNVVASGRVVGVQLPSGFSNCATARLRFYQYNGTGGSTGNRAKIAIDNVSVTRAVPPVAVTLPATALSGTAATLNASVNPGGVPTTAWFEWGLFPFNNTNLTAPVAVGSGTNAVAVSSPLVGLTPGRIYHGRLIASNAAGLARGGDIAFGSPALTMFGPTALTNECHSAYNDPGASANGVPLTLAGGFLHSLALRSDGAVTAWGYNGDGGATVPAGLSDVLGIAAGTSWSLALKSDGTVIAWGRNDYGQTNIPAGLSNVIAFAAGSYHNLALKRDQTVIAWGENSYGQTNIPAGLSNVVAVAAADHNLALKSDGTVVAWGHNAYGQTSVPLGLTNVVAISAGNAHSLALKEDGTVTAWGGNYGGQINNPPGLSNVVAIAARGGHNLAL